MRWVELFEELPVRDGVAARSPPAVHFESAVRIVVALLLPVPSRAVQLSRCEGCCSCAQCLSPLFNRCGG